MGGLNISAENFGPPLKMTWSVILIAFKWWDKIFHRGSKISSKSGRLSTLANSSVVNTAYVHKMKAKNCIKHYNTVLPPFSELVGPWVCLNNQKFWMI